MLIYHRGFFRGKMGDESETVVDDWSKEQWLQKFREIWRSPEDMKVRLNEMLRLYFTTDNILFPDAASKSDSSSAAVAEQIPRFVFLCEEQHRVLPFVLETIKYFEDSIKDVATNESHSESSIDMRCVSTNSPSNIQISSAARAQTFYICSKAFNGCISNTHVFDVAPKLAALFRFADHKSELKEEIDKLLEKVHCYVEQVQSVK